MRVPCVFVRAFVERFVDDELPVRWERIVRAHLARCNRCREEVRALYSLRRTLSLFTVPARDERFWDVAWLGIQARLQDPGPSTQGASYRSSTARNRRLVLAGAALGLVVLLAVGGLYVSQAQQQSQPEAVVPYIDYHVDAIDQHVLFANQWSSGRYLQVSYNGQ